MEFTIDEQTLLNLLKASLNKEAVDLTSFHGDWKNVLTIAERHSILPFVYDSLPESIKKQTQERCAAVVQRYYHLLFLTRYFARILKKHQIPCAILKGIPSSLPYPVPEYRKSGDIDLLVFDPHKLEQARDILIENGCSWRRSEDDAHSYSLRYEKVEVELHKTFTAAFDHKAINKKLREIQKDAAEHFHEENFLGFYFPVLDPPYEALSLLVHMLQHFMRGGFGLKLLADWVVFWNQGISDEDQKTYQSFIQDCHIDGFSDFICSLCVAYLGMKEDACLYHPLSQETIFEGMKDILSTMEFGRAEASDMVRLRGTRWVDFAREFFHQTNLNFPRLSKIYPFLPVLWVITFTKFAHNNRTIRHIHIKDALLNAKKRSRYMAEIHLFKESSDHNGR